MRSQMRTENWPSALSRCRSKATLRKALSVWIECRWSDWSENGRWGIWKISLYSNILMNLAITGNREMRKLEGDTRWRGSYLRWEMLKYVCMRWPSWKGKNVNTGQKGDHGSRESLSRGDREPGWNTGLRQDMVKIFYHKWGIQMQTEWQMKGKRTRPLSV